MHPISIRPGLSTIIAWLLLGSILPSGTLLSAPGEQPPAFAACPPGAEAAGSSAQRATPEDIHVFDPYIGRFRSKTFKDGESGKSFHFVAEYAWFDTTHTIVRFTISTVEEAGGAETINGQGFYGYDPFGKRLYVLGAFSSGTTGFGCVGEFDGTTHRRVTWARSRGADGTTTDVRDSFEIVDADSWKDVTSIRQGAQGEWKVVYQDTFTRIVE